MKRCWKCERRLLSEEFYRDSSRGDGLDPQCKDCRNKKEEARRKADPQRWCGIVKNWQHANPEKQRAISRRSYENNREAAYVRMRRRRARKANAVGSSSLKQLQDRWNYYGGKCWMCGKPANSFDHVIALASGGTDWPSNQRPACIPCNSRKGARNPV